MPLNLVRILCPTVKLGLRDLARRLKPICSDNAHFFGPNSLVMSQDQVWFGPVATSSGLV